ncbi:MAG TPA: hypothetical protein VFP58_04510 [Candidatus Eisenbacteria bacterium]|nr:hypothetical protein [Candidatus Eisenbacteria bacterium]
MTDPIGTWLAALLTLAVLSFLYRDNPVFRTAESLFAGVSLGYYVGIVLDQTLRPNLIEPLATDFAKNNDLLIAGVLGALLYMRYVPRVGWVARYGLAVYVAYYIGVEFTRKIHGEVLPQMGRTIQPLDQGWSFQSVWAFLNSPGLLALMAIVGTYSVLIYFFFSREQGPVTQRVSRVGIWFLMVSFGAAFGFTVMGRVALLIGRINFLIYDWIYPTFGVVT